VPIVVVDGSAPQLINISSKINELEHIKKHVLDKSTKLESWCKCLSKLSQQFEIDIQTLNKADISAYKSQFLSIKLQLMASTFTTNRY